MSITEGHIPVPGTGTNLDTTVITQTDSGVDAHREGVFIADPAIEDHRANVVQVGAAEYALHTTNKGAVGTFGEQLVGFKRDDIEVQFQYDFLDTDFDVKPASTTGDGSVAVTDSALTVSSAVTGTASIESLKATRYRPGHSGYADFTALFSGDGDGKIGIFDTDDGVFIECSSGSMTLNRRRATVDATGVALPATVDGIAVDYTKFNVYRILYGYLGSASPELFVRLGGEFRFLATIDTEGQLATTYVSNPVFPMRVEVENGLTIKTASWSAGTIGNLASTGARPFAFPNTAIVNGVAADQGSMTLTSTNVGTVVIFHSKTTYKTKTNKVEAELLQMDVSVDDPPSGSGDVIIQLVAQPTLSGAASYTDIDSDNSIIEYDHTAGTGASVSYSSGGRVIRTLAIPYDAAKGNNAAITGGQVVDARRLGAIANPDDTFCLIAKDRGGNGVTVRCNLNWEELF